MKELYIKPEVEILLPLTEDIMTSSGNVVPEEKPVNPDAALPSDPSTPGSDTTPNDGYTDPDGDPDHTGGSADVGDLDG